MRATHSGVRIAIVVATGLGASAAAQAATIRVPRDAPTIQAAVSAADDGDTVKVGPGRYCGATIDREVHLVATWATTIIGCDAPLVSGLRAGFFLPDERASGTTIHGFRFDGRGISEDNLAPLAFAIFARDAHGVIADLNLVEGTVQAITNTRGDGWIIAGNVIKDLTLFACRTRCGGGDGIVIQQRDPADDRSAGNFVSLNVITGRVPDGHTLFDMVGVLVIGQERPVITTNAIAIPDNPRATARGLGVLVTDVCCGLPDAFPTTHGAVIVGNDGRRSEVAVIIDRDAGGGTGNSRGAFIAHNLGTVIVDGVRRIAALVAAPYATPYE
jgi:nitrous oxidase accessory protein NosD